MRTFKFPSKHWIWSIIFISTFSIANEKQLVCKGQKTGWMVEHGKIDPDFSQISITFDENKKELESILLTPTCTNNFEQIEKCSCSFEKTSIGCSGLSRGIANPKVIWRFNFSLDRVSGQLSGIRQKGNSGDKNQFMQTEMYDYICEATSKKF
jgi:hypothetical protein